MENRKSKLENRTKITLALLAVALIASLAFSAGYAIANLKVPILQNSLTLDQQSLEALSLTTAIGTSNTSTSCAILESGLGSLNQQLQTLNTEINAAQTDTTYAQDYQNIVNQFAYTRLDYWLLAQRIGTQCHNAILNVLMLYPQNGCSNCVYEGEELSYLEQQSNYTLVATVLNANINISPVQAIDKMYNVTDYPTLIINENNTYVGYENTAQLKNTLCQYDPKFNLCK